MNGAETIFVVFTRKHSGEPERAGLALTRGWADVLVTTLHTTGRYAHVWVEVHPLADYLDSLRAGH